MSLETDEIRQTVHSRLKGIDSIIFLLVRAVLLLISERIDHIEEGSLMWNKLHKLELDIVKLVGSESQEKK